MAGGDFALIKSVESFEDKTEYGERQLMELGFGPNDLLLASTEGGETPFVIGSANKAAAVSNRKPYFLYCNPDEVLLPIIRSREVLENSRINKINLTVGADFREPKNYLRPLTLVESSTLGSGQLRCVIVDCSELDVAAERWRTRRLGSGRTAASTYRGRWSAAARRSQHGTTAQRSYDSP